MRAVDALTTLEELGASQWGLVTTAQAEPFGVSRVALGRLRDDEIIHTVRRGVWALPSADLGPLQELRGAWLSTDSKTLATDRRGPDASTVVSHVSAAAVHSLGDLIPARHEFTAARRRQTTQEDLRFHRASLEDDVVMVDGLPVTSIPRTVQDLAAEVSDLDHLAVIVRDALGAASFHLPDLEKRLDDTAARFGFTSGAALVEGCLDRAGPPAAPSPYGGVSAMANALARLQSGAAGYLDVPSAALAETARRWIASAVTDEVKLQLGGQAALTLTSAAIREFWEKTYGGRPQWTSALGEAMQPLALHTASLSRLREIPSLASDTSSLQRVLRQNPFDNDEEDGTSTRALGAENLDTSDLEEDETP